MIGTLHPSVRPRVNWTHPINRGLVGCWLFNEGAGATAFDIAGVNHATLTNGATWTPGKCGKGMFLDGTNDFAVTTNNYVTAANDPISFSLWAYPMATSNNYNTMVSYAKDGLESITVLAGTAGANADKWAVFIQSPGLDYYYGSTHGLNQWFHIVCVYDGTNISLYVNGVLDVAPTAGTYPARNQPFVFGRFYSSVTSNFYFSGKIDEARIYKRALKHQEIKLLYSEPMVGLSANRLPFFSTSGASLIPSLYRQRQMQGMAS